MCFNTFSTFYIIKGKEKERGERGKIVKGRREEGEGRKEIGGG